MKAIKNIYIGLALLGGAMLSGCQADMDTPELIVPEATMKANTTIAELKEDFWSDDTNYAVLCPEKDEETGEHYIVKGRVISSDATGNVYQSLYIQDNTAAITISVRKQNMYTTFRLGQEVVLDVTGLYIGKYAGLEQIGGYGTYNGTPQVSFCTGEAFMQNQELNGLPDASVTYVNYGDELPESGMYCIVFDKISKLPTDTDGVRKMQSQLVEFRNVSWVEAGEPYSTYQATVSRNITDGGSQLVVRNSGYSNFYTQLLPEGEGTVRGLLGYFNGTWQLTLRSTADVIFDSKGNASDPFTVDEALMPANDGTTAWVQGFIVGSVKSGVSEVTSNDQIVWGTDAETDSNVVIAPTADCKDRHQCMVVELRQGTELRSKVNLIDNPGNIGKTLAVLGKFGTLIGMGGVSGSAGTSADFVLGGSGTPSTPGTGDSQATGSGTEDDPYNVYAVMNMPIGTTASDVWVEGYVVGYIMGSTLSSGARFQGTMENDDTDSMTGYNNTNILLGSTAAANSLTDAIPVKLKAGDMRTQLGLRANPSAYLMHVKLKGNLNKGFGVEVLEQASAYIRLN